MLHPAEDLHQPAEPQCACGFLTAGHASQPDEGIQLVHGAVGFDPYGIFGDSLSSSQSGFALVATLGVDPIESDPGIVERFVRHTSMLTWHVNLGNSEP